MRDIKVLCLKCRGSGSYDPSIRFPLIHFDGSQCHLYGKSGCDFNKYHVMKCDMCNGFGQLIATELKAVVDTRQVTDGDT